MKEKIKILIQNIKHRHPKAIIIVAVLFITTVVVGASVFAVLNKSGIANAENSSSAKTYNPIDDPSVVAILGFDATTTGNKVFSNSWPGEVISSEISQIQPQREGVVVDWRVHIGDNVSAGEVLGKISAAPATPELIKMLAEQTEAANKSKSQAVIADSFASKEQKRLESLKNALNGSSASSTDLSFLVLESLRKKVESKKDIVRSFIERTLSNHVSTLTSFTDWRYLRFGGLNKQYGLYSPSVQNSFEMSFIKLAEKLKGSTDLPIEEAQNYFSLVVQLANNSGNPADYPAVNEFKMTASADQKEFLDVISDYRMAQADLADKETEYKIMINEGGATLEKDRLMAHAEEDAAEASYNTVSGAINGGSYIVSPRNGTVSAIYKKVGELVDPTMPIAVVAGYGSDNLTIRMSIPNNIRKPLRGDLLSVVRPGFPREVHKVKITGVGTSLDETGSYMADAVILDHVDWPAGASVRVIPSENSITPVIKLSSILWNEADGHYMFGVSEAGRIFKRKITIGRTLGSSVEVYSGIKNGDRYLVSPEEDFKENMLLENVLPKDSEGSSSAGSSEKKPMGGMEM
ncbi:MAG: hypothetical protein WC835_02105 [Candidatus Paceibacterota bacterium]|jgi:multidrug efflux pump subunit AcrA (membrane-fusion protein)